MTTSFWALEAGEEVLSDPDELFYRQCPEYAFVDGEPSARIFSESSSDQGKLSGARSTKTTAELAYLHRQHNGAGEAGESTTPFPDKVTTVGTYALTVEQIGEVSTETGLALRAVDDSQILADSAPPGHTYLDQRHLGAKPSNPDKRRLRAELLIRAMRHGRLWPE